MRTTTSVNAKHVEGVKRKSRKGGGSVGDSSVVHQKPEKRFKDSRPFKAVLACASMIAAVVLSIALSGGSFAKPSNPQSLTAKVWDGLESDKGIEDALKEVGAMVLSREGLDEWMREEVLGEEWLGGAIADKERRVVWITKEGELEDVRRDIDGELGSKGWTAASKGTADTTVDTYTKSEGVCKWILAEYAQSGKETVAVLRIERN